MIKIACSGYSPGFTLHHFDPQTGTLSKGKKARCTGDKVGNLAYSDIDQRTGSIYTVHEVEGEGKVSRWKISGEGGEFKVMETFQSKGSYPCHVVVDAKHDLVFVANYCVKENGTMTAFSICPKEGTIKDVVYHEAYSKFSNVEPDRQSAPHAHGTFLTGDLAFVVDLGGDCIHRYRIGGDKKVEKIGVTSCTPGSGPRHLAIDPGRGMIYVLNELKNTVTRFSFKAADGSLDFLEDTEYDIPQPTPGTRQYGSGIQLDPEAKRLYISNRGDGAIVVFELSDQPPKQIQTIRTSGTWPRFFTLCGKRHLLSAEQFKNLVDIYAVDAEDGKLTKTGTMENSHEAPSMLLIYD